jgi:polysaccharide export outer membrane protein
VLLAFAPGSGSAQEYEIGPEDVVEVSFWQDPTLNSSVRVSSNGYITLDIIGKVKAAGKTPEQLQQDIVKQISRLNTKISQAIVRVTQYNYNYVFVTGEIGVAGRISFEKIPDLWTVINEAGAILEFADLSRVTIIRGGKDAGEIIVVNIRKAIADGTLDKLPQIRRQDTIDIPRKPLGFPSGDLAQSSEKKDFFYVIGAVNDPGPIAYQDNTDMLEVIALAGGPSPDANLKKAVVITKDGFYAQSLQVDLEKYSRTGTPARYVLRKEDTVVLPARKGNFLGASLTTVAAVLGAMTSAVIIVDQLSN